MTILALARRESSYVSPSFSLNSQSGTKNVQNLSSSAFRASGLPGCRYKTNIPPLISLSYSDAFLRREFSTFSGKKSNSDKDGSAENGSKLFDSIQGRIGPNRLWLGAGAIAVGVICFIGNKFWSDNQSQGDNGVQIRSEGNQGEIHVSSGQSQKPSSVKKKSTLTD